MITQWRYVSGVMIPLAEMGARGYAEDGHMQGYDMMNFWGAGMFIWIPLILLLLAIGVGVFVYFIVKASHTEGPGPHAQERPLDTLKRRYAKGDITKEQSEAMKKDL